jgi:predicted  nucleic acid-binding Zn-ribbon protein
LYGGKIKNPKELQDLQLEANSLENQINSLENDLLTWMIQVDEMNAEYNDLLRQLENLKKEKSENDEDLKKKNKGFEHKISILKNEREHIITNIDPSLLDSYEKLRSKKNGVEVSRIVSNRVQYVEQAKLHTHPACAGDGKDRFLRYLQPYALLWLVLIY